MVGVLAGIFVSFMIPAMLVGMLTGDPHYQVIAGLVGVGFFVYVLATKK